MNPHNINSIFAKTGKSSPKQLMAKTYEIIHNSGN